MSQSDSRTGEQGRLDYTLLWKKHSIACIVRLGVPDEVVEAFEDSFSKGRDAWNTWSIYPTVSHNDKSTEELLRLCKAFTATDNPFYPYVFLILDEQTTQDGSALLVQQDPAQPGTWMLRLTPSSISVFISCIDIGHFTIEEKILNDYCQNLEDFDIKTAEVYNCPFDHTDNLKQKNIRIPINELQQLGRPHDEFIILRLPKDKAGSHGLPPVDIELTWFGKPRKNLLILSAAAETKLEQRHVVGEQL